MVSGCQLSGRILASVTFSQDACQSRHGHSAEGILTYSPAGVSHVDN